ncbi:hypothetical protein ACFFSY_06920 [Paenibacillus aurantiacus]|uniref:ABC-2 family transporter protein n=1 Tax=Paenibacillus aurantiacus TaxID=1936118 RepID=A0ABV5KN34_9BACL
MSSWQGALMLFRHEMRRSWVGVLITIGFFSYFGFILVLVIGDMLSGMQNGEGDAAFPIDFLMLSLLPNMGFIMNRTVFSYWKTNPYTRKLAYWRTLPIGFQSIVLYRMLQLVAMIAIVGIYFFGIEYAFVAEFREMLSFGQYLLFALFWMGYALLVASTYMFAEQCYSGRTYFIVCWCYIVMYALVVAGLWYLDISPTRLSIELAGEGNPAGALILIVAGIVALLVSGHYIRQKLERRNLIHE